MGDLELFIRHQKFKMLVKEVIKRFGIDALPIVLGGLIYLTYRTETLLMFGWFNKIGLSEMVSFLRSNEQIQNLTIPDWVKFSLPNALWLFSFTYALLILWDFKINKQSAFWLFIVPTAGLSSEIGQSIGIISGTYDKVDLLLLLIATVLPFSQLKNLKTIKFRFV